MTAELTKKQTAALGTSAWPGLAAVVLLLAAGSDRAAFAAAPEPTNAPVSLDYSSFRIIAERNIFNTRRYGRATSTRRDSRPAARVESFALLGTMSYEKGPFAFFEGSRSDYQKVAKPADTIAGYTVTEIAPSYVRLNSGTNELQLRVGMQLRREDEGPWQVSERVEPVEPSPERPVAAAVPATNAPPTAGEPGGNEPPPPIIIVDGEPLPLGEEVPPGAVDPAANPAQASPPPAAGSPEEILRRLMERRRQEENP